MRSRISDARRRSSIGAASRKHSGDLPPSHHRLSESPLPPRKPTEEDLEIDELFSKLTNADGGAISSSSLHRIAKSYCVDAGCLLPPIPKDDGDDDQIVVSRKELHSMLQISPQKARHMEGTVSSPMPQNPDEDTGRKRKQNPSGAIVHTRYDDYFGADDLRELSSFCDDTEPERMLPPVIAEKKRQQFSSEGKRESHRLPQLHAPATLHRRNSSNSPSASDEDASPVEKIRGAFEDIRFPNLNPTEKLQKARGVKAAILSQLFPKKHHMKHTVDDVLAAIDREDSFVHGWEDQRRKPGTTVMFVGESRLHRRAQHGFVLSAVSPSEEVPKKKTVSCPQDGTTREFSHPHRANDNTCSLPHWKQAWKLLSQNRERTGVNRVYDLPITRQFRKNAQSSVGMLFEEHAYSLSTSQKQHIFDQVSQEHAKEVRPLAATTANAALQALNGLSFQQAHQQREVNLFQKSDRLRPLLRNNGVVPAHLDATSYARAHYADTPVSHLPDSFYSAKEAKM